MHILDVLTYVFIFIALYFEVLFLITYFELVEKEKKIAKNKILPSTYKWPSVSVIVPVWNEENTVLKTIFSLLKLDYPKDRFSIFVVDDGSTDNTWKVLQRFSKNRQVKLLKKENGGKYTALNYALEFIDSDLVGCLDADSFVHPKALKKIAMQFEDEKMMAVTPSIKVFEPKGLLGLIQKAEYMFGIYLRKVLNALSAIYITPGPFSIFRRSVFRHLGNYKHAHNTEDIEIALRMQKNGMKIGNVHDAYVYTVIPTNLKALYKQRLRWVYGFLKNAIDYRSMFFNPRYGNLGVVILPAAGFSIVSTLYFFVVRIYSFFENIYLKIKEIYTVGFYFKNFNLDLFYINTSIMLFVSIVAILGVFFIIMVSRNLSEEKNHLGLDSIIYILLYTFIAPFWMIAALYKVAFAKTTRWR